MVGLLFILLKTQPTPRKMKLLLEMFVDTVLQAANSTFQVKSLNALVFEIPV